MCEGQRILRRYKRLLLYGLRREKAWVVARDGLMHCVWDFSLRAWRDVARDGLMHCVWDFSLRAWRDVARDTFWTYSDMLGWVEHARDEIEFIRADGVLIPKPIQEIWRRGAW